MANESVSVEIGANDKFSDVVRKFGESMDQVAGKSKSSFQQATDASKTFATGLAVAGGLVAAGIGLAIHAAAEQEVAMSSMNATLATMGTKGTDAKQKILDLSSSLTKMGFDDNETALSITKLFQRTGDLTEATKLNGIAMDLARAKHMDLATASNMVGMVMSGNGRVLKQFGIDLKATGDPMAALGELQQKLSGQAVAFTQTFTGAWTVFKAQFNELLEKIGTPMLSAATKMMTALSGIVEQMGGLNGIVEKATAAFQYMEPYLPLIAGAIVGALIPAFIAWGTTMFTITIPAIVAGAIALAPYIILGAAVAAVVVLLYKAWQTNFLGIRDITQQVWVAIKTYWDAWWPVIKDEFKLLFDTFAGIVKLAKDLITGHWGSLWGDLKNMVVTLGGDLGNLWNDTWSALGTSLKGILDGMLSYFKGWYDSITGWLTDMLSKIGLVSSAQSKGASSAPKASTAKGHAFGGIVEGESGIDNILVPLSAGEIVLNAMQQQHVASAITDGKGRGDINITVTGNSFYGDDRRFAEKVGDSIMKQLMPHLSFASR